MKTLTLLLALALTATVNAQHKLVNDGTLANHIEIKGGLSFDKNSNGLVISWTAANEANTSQFELQLSYDNKEFETIKTIAAADITNWVSNYEIKFNRTYLTAEKIYYRLKTVFNNGDEMTTTSTSFETTGANGTSFVSVH